MPAIELVSTPLFADANLEGYYRMDSGVLTTDSTANARTLTAVASPIDGTGTFGGASDLGSSNTTKYFYRRSDVYDVSNVGPLTLSCWVKLNTEISTGNHMFLTKHTNSYNMTHGIYYEYNTGTRRVAFWNDNTGIGSTTIYVTGALGTSTWHHLVYVSDGTSFWGFVNGVKTATDSVRGSTSSYTLYDCINVGAIDRGAFESPSGFSNALFDDVAVFSRALTDDEVSNLYNGTFSTFTPKFINFN